MGYNWFLTFCGKLNGTSFILQYEHQAASVCMTFKHSQSNGFNLKYPCCVSF